MLCVEEQDSVSKCSITKLRQDTLAELWLPHLLGAIVLLPYLRLMMRHQNCANSEENCSCATVAARAPKIHNNSMVVSKQIQFSNAKHACRSSLIQIRVDRERYFCTGGRRGGVSSTCGDYEKS